MSTTTLQLLRQLGQQDGEIDRLLNVYRDERVSSMNRREQAEERYARELREIADLDDIDNELNRIEAEHHVVDHNIMRHLNTNYRGGGYEDEGSDPYDDGVDDEEAAYLNEQTQGEKVRSKRPNPVVERRHDAPSFEAKEGMREALFGYLTASRADELELEGECERLKETGGHAAEDASDRLFATQKANATALLQMLKDYSPQTSGQVWGRDPDFAVLVKKLNLVI
jgi:hypothetical protein